MTLANLLPYAVLLPVCERLLAGGLRQSAVYLAKGHSRHSNMAQFVPAVRGKIVEHLRAKGYFIGGIISRWLGEDALLIQKIRQRLNWEGINLHTERARRIQVSSGATTKPLHGFYFLFSGNRQQVLSICPLLNLPITNEWGRYGPFEFFSYHYLILSTLC